MTSPSKHEAIREALVNHFDHGIDYAVIYDDDYAVYRVINQARYEDAIELCVFHTSDF